MRSNWIWIGLLGLSPILLFMVLYSIDAGCFICLYPPYSGTIVERVLNIALAIGFAAIIIFGLARAIKRSW